ncbi:MULTISPECIES: RagB/SusD family nutrient uptake outer membrane protein [Sphingobacterium]|uniref:RagB/SusD family nutrient uptake outer membrane protein n=1 Tax=Sphingobacterium populi TaxID=1812824 RepID=A0ABW5UC61_9SPHI|nr:RagB/SusD family nutrient uptake outer membrane protein [Sphingobacterium sp. CFCC 11742]
MKPILWLTLVSMATLIFYSCSKQGFLDQTVTSDLDKDMVFSDSLYTVQFLNDIYREIGFSEHPNRFGNGGLDAASDESRPQRSINVTTSVLFSSGTITAASIATDAWTIPYANIRKVNQLLANIAKAPIADYQKSIMIAEARFLRAWYYFILVKHYGGVPLVGDTIYTFTDYIPAERASFEECINYIVSECDAVRTQLPYRQIRGEYGRAGGGTCDALKMRALLYAASPLYNRSNVNPLLGYSTADLERWRLAAEAAERIIASSTYNLYTADNSSPGRSFYTIFTLRENTEYIIARMQPTNKELEEIWQPPSRGAAKGGFPYQETVDAFGMANGLPIDDPNSGYDPQNPYAGRDPRLAYSFIKDQTEIANNQGAIVPVNIYLNADGSPSSQDAIYSGTPTGYYTNKMLNPEHAANFIHGGTRNFPLLRYAEVLLSYAEAVNEYSGPNENVYQAIEAIRSRAGLNPYTIPRGLSQEEMRAIIHGERRVELAFEGHRFWDVRRWLMGDTQNMQMHGMQVTRRQNVPTYKIVEVDKHNFRPEMYYWPIPLLEVGKSPELEQNPGY